MNRWLWVLGIGCVLVASAQAQPLPPEVQRRVDTIFSKMVDRWIVQIDRWWHDGQHEHLINMTYFLISVDPHHIEAYENAGWLLWSSNRDDEAVALYERGIRNNPDAYDMYYELGQYYYLRKKDYAKAREYLERAIQYPCQWFVWNTLGHVYARLGERQKAIETWQELLRRFPMMPLNQMEAVRKNLRDLMTREETPATGESGQP
ncbi:MAG: tetratricopeptide repeat protein [Armatimonadota bacterium]|nr:tetratricopeptide repeat protein [bacterium]MCS7308666.1 tetratricopeptide repeat protein [Armatimonadota bacterium]MDW8289440.1 tetratricopeptide repeat protein [Armatimonadota bacterium]